MVSAFRSGPVDGHTGHALVLPRPTRNRFPTGSASNGRTMAFNFNTPSKIFRAFGGLFVLFGGGFYMARRIVSHRRANDLDNHRARESPRGLSMLPFRGLNDQRMQAKSRATTRAQVRKRTDGRRPWSACVSTFASARGVATAGPSWSYKLRRTSGQTQTPRNGVDTGARCLQLEHHSIQFRDNCIQQSLNLRALSLSRLANNISIPGTLSLLKPTFFCLIFSAFKFLDLPPLDTGVSARHIDPPSPCSGRYASID